MDAPVSIEVSKEKTFSNWWTKEAKPLLKHKYTKEQLQEIKSLCDDAFNLGDFFANSY